MGGPGRVATLIVPPTNFHAKRVPLDHVYFTYFIYLTTHGFMNLDTNKFDPLCINTTTAILLQASQDNEDSITTTFSAASFLAVYLDSYMDHLVQYRAGVALSGWLILSLLT